MPYACVFPVYFWENAWDSWVLAIREMMSTVYPSQEAPTVTGHLCGGWVSVGAGTEPTHTGIHCSLAGSCPPPAGTAPSTRLHPVRREARPPSCQELGVLPLMKGLFRSPLPSVHSGRLHPLARWLLLLFLPRLYAPGCPSLMQGQSRRTHSLCAPSKQTAWIPSRGHCPCFPSLCLVESLQYLDREQMSLTNYHAWIPFIPHTAFFFTDKNSYHDLRVCHGPGNMVMSSASTCTVVSKPHGWDIMPVHS